MPKYHDQKLYPGGYTLDDSWIIYTITYNRQYKFFGLVSIPGFSDHEALAMLVEFDTIHQMITFDYYKTPS